MPTLNVKISGSIVGDAIQNDMIGARGTPLKSNPAITGTTVQEQNGLNAPTSVASTIALPIFALNARRIIPSSFSALTRTLNIMLIKNIGQTCQTAEPTNSRISKISFIRSAPLFLYSGEGFIPRSHV
jgi:hypothetical protein